MQRQRVAWGNLKLELQEQKAFGEVVAFVLRRKGLGTYADGGALQMDCNLLGFVFFITFLQMEKIKWDESCKFMPTWSQRRRDKNDLAKSEHYF